MEQLKKIEELCSCLTEESQRQETQQQQPRPCNGMYPVSKNFENM